MSVRSDLKAPFAPLKMAETLTLRNFKADDLDDFMVWASDPEVTKYLTWEPYRSREDALNYITTVAMLDPWCKAICLNGQAIGSLHLRCGTGIHRCVAELGFCLAKKYWGQGIMSQAVRLALSTGFQDLGVFRIQALVEPKNTRSQRALEKADFHREALLRNFVVQKTNGKERVLDSYVFAALPPPG